MYRELIIKKYIIVKDYSNNIDDRKKKCGNNIQFKMTKTTPVTLPMPWKHTNHIINYKCSCKLSNLYINNGTRCKGSWYSRTHPQERVGQESWIQKLSLY